MRTTTLGAGLALAVLVQAGCGTAGTPSEDASLPPKAHVVQGDSAERVVAAKPAVVTFTLPAGAPLVVRTTSTMSTKSHAAGQTFTAQLEQPMVVDGREIAPKGAEVEGRIVDSDKGGRVRDRATIAVQMTRLHIFNGQTLDISTATLWREARGTKRKDATKIGIGGGIGAAIGAIAGGGKGAAIGAGVGAGAGTGLVLATHGDPAVIPSESVLHFTLRAPVTTADSK